MDDWVRCPENPGKLGGCGSRVGGGAEGLACRVTCLACPMLAHAVGLPLGDEVGCSAGKSGAHGRLPG